MLIHPTVERLRALGLAAMADAFLELQNAPDAGELSREDWLGLLVDREATSRENKRLARRLREARLRQSAVVEDKAISPLVVVLNDRTSLLTSPSTMSRTQATTESL
jgi:hypothetical protein